MSTETELSAKQELAIHSSSRGWVFAAAIATILISAIEGTIMATAMPTILGALGGFDSFSWAFTVYFLTQAVTIPIYGRIADIFGRKPVLLAAIGLFLIGSIACGFAWSMASLVAFRVVQGVGAGGLVTLAQTIIGDIFPPAERARIQGYISSIWATGAIFGPLLGGFLVSHVAWPWVFWVNLPVGLIAAIMIVATLHEEVQHRQHRIDYLGSILMTGGTLLLMFALVQAASLAIPTIFGLVVAALALLFLFALQERRAPEPMLPLDLLGNRIVAGGNVASLAVGAVMMGSTAFLSLYVQGVMGRSALLAGVALGGPSLAWPLGSSIGGRLMLRTSYRATAIAGALPMILGGVMMIALDPTSGPIWAASGAMLVGIGMGFTVPTYVVAIQSTVGWGQRGIATSTTVFTRIVGQAIGAALFGGILNASLSSRIAGGADMVTRLMDPALRRTLAAADLAPLMQAVAAGLHQVYLIVFLLILVILTMALCLPKGLSPIRGTHGESGDGGKGA